MASDATGNKPRVVPVSLTPTGAEGGVSDAALAYTKHALNAIIASLNSNKEKYGDIGKIYTARDLSTCLGAWDLSVPSTNDKRLRLEKPPLGSKDKRDADTAFNFYHERSCPILLDAKRSSGPMSFCVDDFDSGGMNESNDDDLPHVVGAIVLTYGADSKFTGGVGEEGVLTKAIIEFFFDPSIVVLGTAYEGKKVTDAVMVEAEEQLFTQTDTDGNRSALVTAALAAMTPSAPDGSISTASSDDGVYIPTIWSGNTEREYRYCLLSTLNDKGQEAESKQVCVAIQKKNNLCAGDAGPAKGVCRITLTLSPESVQAKKKLMAEEEEGKDYDYQTSSAVHRNIRHNIRLLRPPNLTTVSNDTDAFDHGRLNKRKRQALRRTSISQLIDPTLIAVGIRCKHELLLDDDEVGKVYANGVLVADCNLTEHESRLNRIPNSDALPAHLLFGVDFTLPSHKGLPNKSVLEREYGFLLMDTLITPHPKADVVGKVLSRLISGKTEENDVDEVDDDDDDANQNCIKFDTTSSPCFESIALSSTKIDPVGISAKSLCTKFRMQHGTEAFPCEIGTDEKNRLHKLLGAQKIAKLVPTRARNILRRGGYLSLDEMAASMWNGNGSLWDGDHSDSVLVAEAIEKSVQLLRKVGCENVTPNKIRLVSRKQLGPTGDVSKLRSWYDTNKGVYYISDAILFQEQAVQQRYTSHSDEQPEPTKHSAAGSKHVDNIDKSDEGEGKVNDNSEPMCKDQGGEKEDTEDAKGKDNDRKLPSEKEGTQGSETKSFERIEKSGTTPSIAEDAAYLLAFYIAKEHPDATVLEKFIRMFRCIK